MVLAFALLPFEGCWHPTPWIECHCYTSLVHWWKCLLLPLFIAIILPRFDTGMHVIQKTGSTMRNSFWIMFACTKYEGIKCQVVSRKSDNNNNGKICWMNQCFNIFKQLCTLSLFFPMENMCSYLSHHQFTFPLNCCLFFFYHNQSIL